LPTLLAVPNVSEGRDAEVIAAIGDAFARPPEVRLLDVHSDPDHHRSVFTLAGPPGRIADALVSGGEAAIARVDIGAHAGVHPRVGALDVAPVVYVEPEDRGAACAEALLAADRLARELRVPVYLYGALAGGRTRAELRRPGAIGEIPPDFGPAQPHASAGAVLVAARAPLVAFNLELSEEATLELAKRTAAEIRDELPGVRALGLALPSTGRIQVSTNVEDPYATPLAKVVEAVSRRASVAAAELVGLAPQAALDGFPPDLPLRGFDAGRHVIERVLRSG
jgi:glutamate formiminotransferase